MSFLQKFLQTSYQDIFLVKGKADNKNCWHYILVKPSLKKTFDLKIKARQFLELTDYGNVIASGWGAEPPKMVKDKVNELGASYDADSDEELAAYYKSKSDVFFLTATSEGKACYYYVAVDGKIAEEFKRVCSAETPDFADYGNIIESGWGFPSPTIIAYMKEKYSITTPELENA